MTIGSLFYQLFIAPLELLLEAIYGMAHNQFENPGLAIFLMSLVMNILLLPLYRQADAMQAAERDFEKAMEPYVKHIRKTFRGDERFMMLQTYYRQNGYKPSYTLRGMLPLILEIPFFIAAYHFLSNLKELQGGILGPIQNLGAPDGLIVLGAVTLNALPILMTLVNIVSSSIYTKGFAFKDKATLYGMALIFLVLLYNSPSGLVFYWTLNNLFSLVKNLFYKLKNPRKTLARLLSVVGAVLAAASVFYYHGSAKYMLRLLVLACLMEYPILRPLLQKKRGFGIRIQEKSDYTVFLLGGLFLAVLTGVLIPSAVVAASPEEFVQLEDYYSPLWHVINAALCAVGTFVVWLGVFYFLLGKKAKRVSELVIAAVSVPAVVNYMFFGAGLGLLTASLTYENDTAFETGTAFSLISASERLLNLGVAAAIAGILGFLFLKKERIVKVVCAILLLAAAGLCVHNIVQIQKVVPGLQAAVREKEESETAGFSLSRNGKNVVVIMLDRAVSSYIPYLFQEKPELEEQFSGFTYYPNTLSFGAYTNAGVPALFGGYEYTPTELNKRTEESLVSKHNEALKVMPVLFHGAGYEVTICEPVYAGYTWIPDLSVFDDYPDFHVYNTEQGQFNVMPDASLPLRQNAVWRRNFFCYSVMKISPLLIQPNLYQHGSYFGEKEKTVYHEAADISHAEGIKQGFLQSFSVLCSLPEMTNFTEEGDTYLAMANSATHEACLLSEPEYYPAEIVDNEAYDAANQSRFIWNGREMKVETIAQMMHYQVNMASLIQIGNWLDYLRENNVYDNTRIIIVADHGQSLHQFEDLTIDSDSLDVVMAYNPLLLVKDFDAQGFTSCYDFMTNADVPACAMQGLLDDPVNPFTGKPISSDGQKSGEMLVYYGEWDTWKNNGNTFLPGRWYSVHDNIFDLNNWAELGKR